MKKERTVLSYVYAECAEHFSLLTLLINPKSLKRAIFTWSPPFALVHAVTLMSGVLGTDLPSVDISVHGAISASAPSSTSAIAL